MIGSELRVICLALRLCVTDCNLETVRFHCFELVASISSRSHGSSKICLTFMARQSSSSSPSSSSSSGAWLERIHTNKYSYIKNDLFFKRNKAYLKMKENWTFWLSCLHILDIKCLPRTYMISFLGAFTFVPSTYLNSLYAFVRLFVQVWKLQKRKAVVHEIWDWRV